MHEQYGLFGWWITYGLLATLVPGPVDREAAMAEAAKTFSKHRRRDIPLDDLIVRQATEVDVFAFAAASDRKWVAPEVEPEPPEPDPEQGALAL